VATSESLDDHFAGLREGFLTVLCEDGKNSAQEGVLGGAEVVENVRECGLCLGLLTRLALGPSRPAARAVEGDAVVRRHTLKVTPGAELDN
jgi:hypothetical protein